MARVVGAETLTVAASAVGFTKTNLATGATLAFCGPVETADIRWDDGRTPTASVGHLFPIGCTLEFDGDLNAVRFISTGASVALPVTYYRVFE
jgi:hypothetical protein